MASAASSPLRRSGYRATSPRWHVVLRRLPETACLLGLAVAAAGCSFSYQLDNLLMQKDNDAGSQPPAAAGSQAPVGGDLAFAKAAVSEALTRGGKDSSMPWENPHTGARGTITPLAQGHSHAGITCRGFLASYVRNGSESWLQGEACRAGRGKWEVRNLRPWKST